MNDQQLIKQGRCLIEGAGLIIVSTNMGMNTMLGENKRGSQELRLGEFIDLIRLKKEDRQGTNGQLNWTKNGLITTRNKPKSQAGQMFGDSLFGSILNFYSQSSHFIDYSIILKSQIPNQSKILDFIQKKQQILFQQIYNLMSNNQKALELLDKLISRLEANVESPEIKPAELPKVEVKVEKPKEQVKEQTKETQHVVEKKEPKKKKGDNPKQNKKQQPEKPKLPPGADEDILTFSECDLRVSEIVECWKHPESTYLYCEKILVGKELREIASGLQEYIPIEQMKGKVIVFANLKPRPLGGFNSNGMVICASNQPQNQFDLLCPEGPLGERLYLEGFEELFQTGEEILPVIKKKTLEKCKQHFSTDADGYVIWKGFKLRTKAGPIRSKITNGLVD